jgi:predicted dienelactone hydrolase
MAVSQFVSMEANWRRLSVRAIIVGFMCLAFGLPALPVRAESFYAGSLRFTVQDATPFEVVVWYPSASDRTPTQEVEIAGSARLPVIILSHGRGGSPFGHRALADRLARDGFVVVAPAHVGDSAWSPERHPQRQVLVERPRQARKALEAVLADTRFAPRLDASRLGMVGFSAGGYTTLVLAGARPSFAHAITYCHDHADDLGSCGPQQPEGEQHGAGAPPEEDGYWKTMREPRLKAIVLMDPLAILFDKAALASVELPALLIRPAHDDYLHAGSNALAVANDLGRPPELLVVPGSHFVLLDPCPSEIAAKLPQLCIDGPGVDRQVIHRQIEDRISAFFKKTL